MKQLIGYCGLDCEQCDARKATLNNDAAERERIAKLWSELNGADITPEMINCDGCRMQGRATPYCLSLCPIRQCALKKGCETCGDCEKMEGCQTVGMITENNAEAADNLKQNS